MVESLPLRMLLAADGFATGVTGGSGGSVVTATTAAQLNAYINQTAPLTIQVLGTIDLRPLDGANGRVFTKGNKTIVGVGPSPTVIGNLNITNGVQNVIVQNLYWTNPQDDADGLTIWNGRNVWVNHVSFFDCGDGMCDVNNGSNDVTVSWCKFYYPTRSSHRFTMIADGTSTEKLRITFHHNWWAERCDQRMASSTNAWAHYYNNYFTSTGNYYCSLARDGTQILSENNFYNGVRNPLYKGTFVNGNGIRASGNTYVNCTDTIDPGTDAVFAPTYTYTLDPTASVPALVSARAGVQDRPIVVTPANAAPASVIGTTTMLSALGSIIAGLRYTWSVLSKPVNAVDPTFSANGTNAAKWTKASFAVAGSYQFRATMADAYGQAVTSDVAVAVTIPTVTSSSFQFEQSPNKVTVAFSHDVAARIAASQLSVRSVATGSLVTGTSFIYSASTRSATLSMPPLANGNYRLTVARGELLLVDQSFDFFVLTGDANRDRKVDFDDLLIVAANYNRSPRTPSTGDFNYDGVVNFEDLLILASAYNASLAPAGLGLLHAAPPPAFMPDADARADVNASADADSPLPHLLLL